MFASRKRSGVGYFLFVIAAAIIVGTFPSVASGSPCLPLVYDAEWRRGTIRSDQDGNRGDVFYSAPMNCSWLIQCPSKDYNVEIDFLYWKFYSGGHYDVTDSLAVNDIVVVKASGGVTTSTTKKTDALIFRKSEVPVRFIARKNTPHNDRPFGFILNFSCVTAVNVSEAVPYYGCPVNETWHLTLNRTAPLLLKTDWDGIGRITALGPLSCRWNMACPEGTHLYVTGSWTLYYSTVISLDIPNHWKIATGSRGFSWVELPSHLLSIHEYNTNVNGYGSGMTLHARCKVPTVFPSMGCPSSSNPKNVSRHQEIRSDFDGRGTFRYRAINTVCAWNFICDEHEWVQLDYLAWYFWHGGYKRVDYVMLGNTSIASSGHYEPTSPTAQKFVYRSNILPVSFITTSNTPHNGENFGFTMRPACVNKTLSRPYFGCPFAEEHVKAMNQSIHSDIDGKGGAGTEGPRNCLWRITCPGLMHLKVNLNIDTNYYGYVLLSFAGGGNYAENITVYPIGGRWGTPWNELPLSSMQVKQIAKEDGAAPGFSLHYRCVAPTFNTTLGCAADPYNPILITDGVIFSDVDGRGTWYYQRKNMKCHWLVTCPSSLDYIRIDYLSYYMYQGSPYSRTDVVSLDNSLHFFGRGTMPAGKIFQKSTLPVSFIVRSYTAKNGRNEGFTLRTTCVSSRQYSDTILSSWGCPANITLTALRGAISSDIDGRGTWKITMPVSCLWRIHCPSTSMHIDMNLVSYTASSAYIRVQSPDSLSQVVARYSTNFKQLPWSSMVINISIPETSRAILNGFDISYRCVAPSTATALCPLNSSLLLTKPNGTVRLALVPLGTKTCRYRIQCPGGSGATSLRITSLKIPIATNNFIQIGDEVFSQSNATLAVDKIWKLDFLDLQFQNIYMNMGFSYQCLCTGDNTTLCEGSCASSYPQECKASSNHTCSGNGIASGTFGQGNVHCQCDVQWNGTRCDQCASDYTEVSGCQEKKIVFTPEDQQAIDRARCITRWKCSGNGIGVFSLINGTISHCVCQCDAGFKGERCDVCDIGYNANGGCQNFPSLGDVIKPTLTPSQSPTSTLLLPKRSTTNTIEEILPSTKTKTLLQLAGTKSETEKTPWMVLPQPASVTTTLTSTSSLLSFGNSTDGPILSTLLLTKTIPLPTTKSDVTPSSSLAAAPPFSSVSEAEAQTVTTTLSTTAVGGALLGSAAPSDIQALAMLSFVSCANPSIRKSTKGTKWLITPFQIGNSEYGFLMGSIVLFASFGLLHASLVKVIACVKKVDFWKAAEMGKFPSKSFTAWNFVIQGISFEATRQFAMREKRSTSGIVMAIVALGLMIGLFVSFYYFLKKVLVKQSEFYIYQFAPKQYPFGVRWMLPKGQWRPSSFRHKYSALMNSGIPENGKFLALVSTCRALATAVIASFDAATELQCNLQFIGIGLVSFLTGILISITHPYRFGLVQILVVFNSLTVGIVIASPAISFLRPVAVKLIVVMSVLSVCTTIVNLSMSLWERFRYSKLEEKLSAAAAKSNNGNSGAGSSQSGRALLMDIDVGEQPDEGSGGTELQSLLLQQPLLQLPATIGDDERKE